MYYSDFNQLVSWLAHCRPAGWGIMPAYADQMAISSVVIHDTKMKKETNSCTYYDQHICFVIVIKLIQK